MRDKKYITGESQERGLYECTNCGMHIVLEDEDKMPPCPKCNSTTYIKLN